MNKKKSNLTTFCISHEYIKFLDSLDLNVIGSAGNKFDYPKSWLKDNSGKKEISSKNPNYGTLTSIFWIWKNKTKYIKANEYIGMCHYRRFWLKENHDSKINKRNLKKNILRSIPKKYENIEAFVCKPIDLRNYKLSKLIKKAKINILKDPSILFDNKKHTINLHFDMFHIKNGLLNSIELLNKKDKSEFLYYVNNKTYFYPLSIFVMKKRKFKKLCSTTFSWLKKCEKLFDQENLDGYGRTRIYDFLAERYFSFWISKYCKYKVWPYLLLETRNK